MFFKKFKYKYILKIDGMKCGACEAHVNEIIRKSTNVRKLHSSARKKMTIIESNEPIDIELIKINIEKQGYKVLDVQLIK